MMWGSLWNAVRFYELAPEEYVRLVIKNISVEQDESTIATLLGRVSTALNYYIESEPPAVAGGLNAANRNAKKNPSATADGSDLRDRVEQLLINKIETAPTVGQKITYFRALQSIGSGEQTKRIFKDLLTGRSKMKNVELKTKDKFDLVTRLIILGDKDALNLLAKIEKEETGDAAKRYAYAARGGIPTAENKAKYWNDFVSNKEISENWIESAFAVFNTPRHSELTLPYLEKALAELPNLKRNRKIFFVNGWLGAFIGGQKSVGALNIVNEFLEKNPNLDKDLRLKILENSDNLERAVKIREKFGKRE
jgi:aminopeptidase N